jgi:deoxyadenosine/deoxycytidine kinase
MRQPVVIIEGLIASGKSTLATELGKALGDEALCLLEPDEKDNANPYLALFYGEKERWSFTMQCHLLAKRYRMQLQAQWHAMSGQGPAVLDRSYYGDTCFARMLAKSGDMTDSEFGTYQTLYQGMTASVLLPNVCVRVLVDPETSQERIMRRMELREGRRSESAIDVGYLRALDREIEHMVGVLRAQGVTILDMPWDVDRDTPAQRAQAVKSLASRIRAIEPVDFFLDLHRRTT